MENAEIGSEDGDLPEHTMEHSTREFKKWDFMGHEKSAATMEVAVIKELLTGI